MSEISFEEVKKNICPVHLTLFFPKHHGRCRNADSVFPNVKQNTPQQWVGKDKSCDGSSRCHAVATGLHRTDTLNVNQLNQIRPVLWQSLRSLTHLYCLFGDAAFRTPRMHVSNCMITIAQPTGNDAALVWRHQAKPQQSSRDSCRLSPDSTSFTSWSNLFCVKRLRVQVGLETGVAMKV